MILFDRKILNFLLVGVINTLFGYGVYILFIFLGFSYLIALLIATISGVVFNYFSFGRLVFHTDHHWFIWGKFIAAYGIVYGINAFFLGALTDGDYLNVYLAQAVCLIPSVLISWLIMNYWVYKNESKFKGLSNE